MARHTNLQHDRGLRPDQCLACGGGIGVTVHQHGRDHGKYCRAYPSCQCEPTAAMVDRSATSGLRGRSSCHNRYPRTAVAR